MTDEKIKPTNAELKKILNIGIKLSTEKNRDHLLAFILESGMDITHCDASTLYLFEDGKLHFKIMKSLSQNISRGVEGEPIDDMQNSYMQHHFEHVDEYVLENKKKYRYGIMPVPREKCYPNVSLTVDTLEDYEKACYILKKSHNEYVTTEEAIKLCMQYV